jgi:uncharacterized membrane protein YjdF
MDMIIKATYFISAACLAVLFLFSYFGFKRGWYEKKGNWFSRIMHFLGGFFVAMFLSGLIQGFWQILMFTFLVGVFWEIWEYYYGIYKLKKFGTKKYMTETRDTMEDLFCDILGAVVLLILL